MTVAACHAQGRPPMVLSDQHDDTDDVGSTDAIGSTNVPMDSFIYPALERLSTMGLIPSQMVSIRPWTRKECLRQLHEAEEAIANADPEDARVPEARRLFADMARELEPPRGQSLPPKEATLDSAYVRVGTIDGPAITDSYHFGQTWINDYGRPLARGTSGITGYTLHAGYGRFFFFNREELQRGPATPAITASESALFFQLDNTISSGFAPNFYPVTPAGPAYWRVRPLELYAGVAFGGSALSFGKQQLYWGPSSMGPWSFSSNAEPTYNLRLIATRPYALPFVPSLGTVRYDLVFGRLSGHKYPARPYFNGVKVDFNFVNTLEMSFTRWSLLWGEGHPITFGSLWNNIKSTRSTGCGGDPDAYGNRCDPGDRKSDWDFRLHVPGLKNYLTLYADAYADDEPNPIDNPRRVAWSPGFLLARLPGLPHVDLRVEMASSEALSQDEGGKRFFINEQYRDANTNKGFLLGNAIGRDARAFQYESTYWQSARTTYTAGFRQTKGSENFLPGGSTISDAYVKGGFGLGEQWSAQFYSQYERFLIPAMMAGVHHNVSGWFQMTWRPKLGLSQKDQ